MKLEVTVKNTVDKELDKLKKSSSGMVSASEEMAAMFLWDKTINEQPKPPVDTGNLRGSGKVEKIANGYVFGLDTPYAAYQHELGPYATHRVPSANSDSGPKFVSTKMQKYLKFFAEKFGVSIKSSLDNQGKPKEKPKEPTPQ